jgi:hypothetical protein
MDLGLSAVALNTYAQLFRKVSEDFRKRLKQPEFKINL